MWPRTLRASRPSYSRLYPVCNLARTYLLHTPRALRLQQLLSSTSRSFKASGARAPPPFYTCRTHTMYRYLSMCMHHHATTRTTHARTLTLTSMHNSVERSTLTCGSPRPAQSPSPSPSFEPKSVRRQLDSSNPNPKPKPLSPQRKYVAQARGAHGTPRHHIHLPTTERRRAVLYLCMVARSVPPGVTRTAWFAPRA